MSAAATVPKGINTKFRFINFVADQVKALPMQMEEEKVDKESKATDE